MKKGSLFFRAVSLGSEMDIEAQKEVKGKRLNLRELLIDYSSNSSIHGIKYVFSENRNWLSR